LDPEALREYIKNNQDKSLKETGVVFGAINGSILYRIRQLGITYQKIILYHEREEEKRKTFAKFLSKKQIKKLVFIDESGTNHQNIKKYV
jgi:hypothetical protein